MHIDELAGSTIGRDEGTVILGDWSMDAPAEGEEPMAMAPLHRHHHDDEAWYVLEGRLSVVLDGETITVGAGGAIIATAGTAHTFLNPGPGPCRYVLVMTPQIARLIEATHAIPDEQRAERMPEVYRTFDSELLA